MIRRAFRAEVSPRFGARPTVEADLLVRVGRAAINDASTPGDLMQALDQVIPFIELPDMLVETPLSLDVHSPSRPCCRPSPVVHLP